MSTLTIFIANNLYGEHYITLPMSHTWKQKPEHMEIAYSWKTKGRDNFIKVKTELPALPIVAGGEAEFITEHYWGYTRIDALKTSEYQVEHPKWNAHKVIDFDIKCHGGYLYGAEFEEVLNRAPDSVFMADGSAISVNKKRVLRF